jgi:acetoin utilization deacetylase AcuC-like enzyme
MTLLVIEQGRQGTDQPWTLDRAGGRTLGAEGAPRAAAILRGLAGAGGEVLAAQPDRALDELLESVHRPEYLRFLRHWSERLEPGRTHVPHERSAPGVPQDTPLSAGIYTSALESALVAVNAAAALGAARPAVYALCRPPGHHAGPDWSGGYCFLNNAALAAAVLARRGLRPGVLDLDYHVGNGTAAILAGWDGVPYASVHADTETHYPWTADLPGVAPAYCSALAAPPSAAQYVEEVGRLLDRLAADGVGSLVVSLGYDTLAGDPHGDWRLRPEDFGTVAALIAARGLPVCVVQEGGYLVPALADCAESFAEGLAALTTLGDSVKTVKTGALA